MIAEMTSYPAKQKFHSGEIVSPVLALELARDAADLQEVFQTEHPKEADAIRGPESLNAYRAVSALERDTVDDCGFIPLYSLFLFSMAVLFTSDTVKRRTRLLAGLLIAAVAVLDYFENVGIFKAINAQTVTTELAHAIRYPSLGKWTLLGITLLFLGGIIFVSQVEVFWDWTRKLLGIAFVITGLMLLIGTTCPMWFASANILFSVLLIVSACGLLTPFLKLAQLVPEPDDAL